MRKKITIPEIIAMKGTERISCITAYDHAFARFAQQSGIDLILVGDSLGMVFQGKETTLEVTCEQMIYHSRIVANAVSIPVVIADLPFLSSRISIENLVENSLRLITEGRAHGVKIEGASDFILKGINHLTSSGVPVMGHLGLTPQSYHQLGGFKKQGLNSSDAEVMLNNAKSLEKSGVFSIVLESIPESLGELITNSVSIPTIGIGAGAGCDGQVLVINDLLGMDERFSPSFVKKYANLHEIITTALSKYNSEVKNGAFPTKK
ncbi:MAG: 3-methyl-2-oxobutanoate hydroxymethyltransferase [Deltaproteobacteria bacterium]|nr:3-methyl-2-oxobutanoate hydroxymethyltransferase [Deltaproteobacteria bacterium]